MKDNDTRSKSPEPIHTPSSSKIFSSPLSSPHNLTETSHISNNLNVPEVNEIIPEKTKDSLIEATEVLQNSEIKNDFKLIEEKILNETHLQNGLLLNQLSPLNNEQPSDKLNDLHVSPTIEKVSEDFLKKETAKKVEDEDENRLKRRDSTFVEDDDYDAEVEEKPIDKSSGIQLIFISFRLTLPPPKFKNFFFLFIGTKTS